MRVAYVVSSKAFRLQSKCVLWMNKQAGCCGKSYKVSIHKLCLCARSALADITEIWRQCSASSESVMNESTEEPFMMISHCTVEEDQLCEVD